MAQNQITMPVWGKTPLALRAVQGEAQSRTIYITLIDAGGQPIDLSDASTRLYVQKPDKTKVFMDGTIDNPSGALCHFTLPSDAVAAAGTAECQVLVSWPDNRSLKVVGLSLEVLPSNLDEAMESTDDFSALVTALNKADAAADTAQQAAVSAQQALSDAQTAITDANSARDTALAAADHADASAQAAESAAQDALNSHSMLSPITHCVETITKVINDVYTSVTALGGGAPTAAEYAAYGLTADQYAAKHITAARYSLNGKSLLGG